MEGVGKNLLSRAACAGDSNIGRSGRGRAAGRGGGLNGVAYSGVFESTFRVSACRGVLGEDMSKNVADEEEGSGDD